MNPPVDTSSFQLGVLLEEEIEGEEERLRADQAEARAFIEGFRWAPPIKDVLLASGIGCGISLFLVRFLRPIESPEAQGDNEVWVVVGNWTPVYMETDVETAALALELYCAILQDWAETVLEGRDRAECYPFPFPATPENAKGALEHIQFVRDQLISEAGNPENISSKPL